MALEWVGEPPDKRRAYKEPAYGWEALDELKANPGRWAKLHTYAVPGSAASASVALRKRGFEAEARKGDLYARWPGPGRAKAEPTPIRKTNGRSVGYPCDHCDEELDTPGALKHHVRRHHPDAA